MRLFFFQVNFPFRNLSDPSGFGLNQTYHFKLQHEDVSLGVWHTLPKDIELQSTNSLEEHFQTHFGRQEKEIVILYLHGNTQDR